MSEQAPAPLPAQAPAFIHLHLHSEFSIADSTIGIKPLVGKIRELDMPAVAVADICNFFALVKFYKAAQGAGVTTHKARLPCLCKTMWVIKTSPS